MPYLSVAKREFPIKFDLLSIVTAILYKLKSGCQWEYLPMRHFFDGEVSSYKTVFHHYRKWCKLGDWEMMFSRLFRKYLHLLDLSLLHIDGSHTPSVRGRMRRISGAKPPILFILPTDRDFLWQCPSHRKVIILTCIS